ncbi:hypothetical protein [Kitasatospora acidiphila]|uniref:hypothetical protein n=1 Tax=Kitasatospora acidiphila TaxID=2567942 RepID=UPI0015F0E6E6|nr:hypothetical protein [Kitasatospora acidiphila]
MAAVIGIGLLQWDPDICLGAGVDAVILVLVGLALRLHWIRRQRRAAVAARR